MGLVDDVIDLLTADPSLTVILAGLLLLVFGGYFFLRRLLVESVQSYQEGRSGR
jgi:LPXTG-motif cell wall-anchored protein